MRRFPASHHRGFTLMEMIMTLALIALFLSMATQLFHTSFKLIGGTAAFDVRATQFDHALAAMRRDVWESRQRSATPRELTIELGDGHAVTWSTSDMGGLVRTERDGGSVTDERRWPALPPIRFDRQGSGVLLTVAGKSGDERLEMVAAMQVLEARP